MVKMIRISAHLTGERFGTVEVKVTTKDEPMVINDFIVCSPVILFS
jgi:hypothetical protein